MHFFGESDFASELSCDSAALCPLYLPKIGQTIQTKPYTLCGEIVHLVHPSWVTSEEGADLSAQKAVDGSSIQ